MTRSCPFTTPFGTVPIHANRMRERGTEKRMDLPKYALDILVCPVCKTRVELLSDGSGLKCSSCRRVYPVRDEIPGMLPEEAKIAEEYTIKQQKNQRDRMSTNIADAVPRLKRWIPRLRGKRIGVLGGLMLGRYLWGTASRLSPEAAVPVVDFAEQGECLGGAGNVAANIATLGAHVEAFGGMC